MIPTTCSVALPLPSTTPYDYALPPALVDRVVPGARVLVPVRSREMVGIVVATRDGPLEGLKPVLLAPDPVPLLPLPLLDLGRWMAAYYAAPLGLSLRTMLPSALWGSSRLIACLVDAERAAGGVSRLVTDAIERAGGRASAAVLRRTLRRPVWDALQRLSRSGAVSLETEPADVGPRRRTEQAVRLTRLLPTLLERRHVFGRAERQRAAYEAIDGMGGEATVHHLERQFGFSRGVLRGLAARGVAELVTRERPRDPFAGFPGEPPATPNDEQRTAIGFIEHVGPGRAAVLQGVTGSGKTLVYLESLRRDVAAGRGAIVLVPEIALTPQTVGRVRGVFGDKVAVLHSGLSDGERVDAWRALAGGAKRVAVGARSAVFAPVRDLAAIIVDEEHDASYKQTEQPRYHARDVALRRARLERARVVLGSATPAIETWAARDRAAYVQLRERVGGRPLPAVSLIDMRSATRVGAAYPVPWSGALDAAIEAALTTGDQVMLLLNRRGFAHFLQCQSCGWVWECPACSISLTVHQTPSGLRCHYCGYAAAMPDTCPECGATAHRTRGVGTQSLERWLAQRFSGARVARMDADTTSGKWSHQRILDAVARRDVDVLFGTQMIAKGLDFPGVTLVGVVDADTGLHLPDFRAAERTFQLIAQVAGRAGRGSRGGQVLVQTHTPGHYALTLAAAHDFEGFAERELEMRRDPPYSPHVALANLIVSGRDERRVPDAAVAVAEWLRGLLAARAPGAADVLGPAPAPLARLSGRWRWHVVIRTADRGLLGRVVRYAARRVPHRDSRSVRVVIDRDPVSLL